MTISLPKLRRRTSGMFLKKKTGRWQVFWKEDGVLKFKSLGTSDVEEAIGLRDEERARLIAAGATVKGANTITVTADSQHYIYKRKPYEVRLPDGRRLGFFPTEDAARTARNEALNLTQHTPS